MNMMLTVHEIKNERVFNKATNSQNTKQGNSIKMVYFRAFEFAFEIRRVNEKFATSVQVQPRLHSHLAKR